MRTNLSLLDLDVHILATTKASNMNAMTMKGKIMWSKKRSKKRTFTLQLVIAKNDKKSKLKIPSGKAISKNIFGQGTLSRTFGIEEKI